MSDTDKARVTELNAKVTSIQSMTAKDQAQANDFAHIARVANDEANRTANPKVNKSGG